MRPEKSFPHVAYSNLGHWDEICETITDGGKPAGTDDEGWTIRAEKDL